MTYAYYPQGGELAFEPTQGIANTTISINVSTEDRKTVLGLSIGLGLPTFILTALGVYIAYRECVMKVMKANRWG